MQPIVLSIAGSDSSGGAGIQADLKAITANGGYAATVITAITAQNTRRVLASRTVPDRMLRAQLDAVFDDLRVAAVKTGMLGDARVIGTVAKRLARRRPPVLVCDPVMVAKSGDALLEPAAVGALESELLPLADLVTPNLHEAAALSGSEVRSLEDAERAARRILERGCRAVLVKGGHLAGAPTDLLVTPQTVERFEGPRLDARHTHGTGCTYAAAIATRLARGSTLVDAIRIAKRFVTEAIRHGLAVGRGTGPTDPFFFLRHDDAGWLGDLRGDEERG